MANDLINEAFTYQRNNRTEENGDALLMQFLQGDYLYRFLSLLFRSFGLQDKKYSNLLIFTGCEERNHLRTLLQFSLDDQEEIAFSRYLESSKHPAADDLRVLYLLKRSR